MVSTSFCDLIKYVALKSKPGSSLDVLLNIIDKIGCLYFGYLFNSVRVGKITTRL